MALEAVVESPSSINIHPDQPEESFDHREGAVGAKVTGRRRVVYIRHPRMHEYRYVDEGGDNTHHLS